MKAIGIILVVAGILMMVFSGFNFTTKETVAEIGPVEINKQKEHHINWPVYLGGVVLLGGIGVLLVGSRKK